MFSGLIRTVGYIQCWICKSSKKEEVKQNSTRKMVLSGRQAFLAVKHEGLTE